MKSLRLLFAALALATIPACQTNKASSSVCMDMPPYQGSAAFVKLKSLVGRWKGETCIGPATTEFRLIAGGSVIEEHFAKGTPMEMLSTYHDVEGKLVMTHYCALRNQPRMRLSHSTADSLTFDFIPTPGLNPAKDKHMHGATYTFVDANHLKVEGVAWDNGKSSPCGPAVIYTRR